MQGQAALFDYIFRKEFLIDVKLHPTSHTGKGQAAVQPAEAMFRSIIVLAATLLLGLVRRVFIHGLCTDLIDPSTYSLADKGVGVRGWW